MSRSPLTALLPAESPSIVWRQLRPLLWVGRADDLPLGTIERGHRYTATDPDGDVRGGYRSLEAAQAALTGEIPIIGRRPQQARDPRRVPPALLIGTTLAMLSAVTLSMTGLAVLD